MLPFLVLGILCVYLVTSLPVETLLVLIALLLIPLLMVFAARLFVRYRG